MSLKEVYAPHLGRNVKFGRKIPEIILPHPRMSELECIKDKSVVLPPDPNTVDWTPKALTCLQQLFMNDSLGDCVIAAIMHALGIWTGNAGTLVTATQAQVLSAYEAIGGYVPGQPNTDNGCNIQTMFSYFMNNTLPDGSKLLGYVGVDPTNPTQVIRAINLFENLILGLALPDAWISPFPSANGFVWDVAGNIDPNNGHCIVGGGGSLPGFKVVGYTAEGVVICTWGLLGIITWAALAKYAVNANSGECYSVLNEDILTKNGSAPNGFNWLALVQYWDAMGGNVPVPNPAPPAPSPTPTPSTQVTCSQVLGWLSAAFKTSAPLMFRNQALQVAQKAVAKDWPNASGHDVRRILAAKDIVVTDAEIEAVLKINKNPSFRKSWDKK
jgi:hypothetical protein